MVYGEETEQCIDPKDGDADLWTKIFVGNNLHRLVARDIVVDVGAWQGTHRTKKDKKDDAAHCEVCH